VAAVQSETRKEQACYLLATGMPVREAARQVGLSHTTLYRLQQDRQWQGVIERFRSESLGKLADGAADGIRRLQTDMVPRALNALNQDLKDCEAGLHPVKVKLEVCREVLDRGGVPRQQKTTQETRALHVVAGSNLDAIVAAGRALRERGVDVLSMDLRPLALTLREEADGDSE